MSECNIVSEKLSKLDGANVDMVEVGRLEDKFSVGTPSMNLGKVELSKSKTLQVELELRKLDPVDGGVKNVQLESEEVRLVDLNEISEVDKLPSVLGCDELGVEIGEGPSNIGTFTLEMNDLEVDGVDGNSLNDKILFDLEVGREKKSGVSNHSEKVWSSCVEGNDLCMELEKFTDIVSESKHCDRISLSTTEEKIKWHFEDERKLVLKFGGSGFDCDMYDIEDSEVDKIVGKYTLDRCCVSGDLLSRTKWLNLELLNDSEEKLLNYVMDSKLTPE
ncbi:uncharacterized protein LOC133804591 [Humulus lupulus]|uniref:uncharacterized protein LOC133804591 n=1 Tax=Humulus lupulus TaxID=3486 RepID=UPI002B41403C|nr:uncharacterized protein LOC133804591 [Humulus lupulus]